MLGILIIISLGLISLAFTVNAQSTDGGGIGALFDGKSDSNSNVSFIPGEGQKSVSNDNVTVGQEKALNNTVGNSTEFMNPNFDESKPIKEYDSNSSDWARIIPIDPPRSD